LERQEFWGNRCTATDGEKMAVEITLRRETTGRHTAIATDSIATIEAISILTQRLSTHVRNRTTNRYSRV